MYHNAPPCSPHDIDWNQVFFNECAQSRRHLLNELAGPAIPQRIIDKIDKAIENNGLTITNAQFLAQLATDEVYQSQIMAHPSRQGFHERVQIKHFSGCNPRLNGYKAQGVQQLITIPTNPNSKNWVDCVVEFKDSTGAQRCAYGSMKFARTQGSHQSRQITDQKNFLLRCQEYISLGYAQPSDLFFGAGDGDFFHPNQDNKNDVVSNAIQGHFQQIFNGTTGQVIEWLLSF